MPRRILSILPVILVVAACGTNTSHSPTAPGGGLAPRGSDRAPSTLGSDRAERPPFNLEARLEGDGFGLVFFRQRKDPAASIIHLGVWVRDLIADTSYSLQRAVDTVLDDVCTGTNWLTLGEGSAPQSIVTDSKGTGRAELWRDLSAVAPASAFDIHFRIIEDATAHVALQSGCYRFVVRD